MTSAKNILRSEVRTLRDKHCYFLMSAAGASIAFSVTQMSELTREYENILLLAALVFWAASFYFGHRFLMTDENLLWANHTYLEQQTQAGQGLLQWDLVHEAFDDAAGGFAKKSERARSAQFLFLCLGAVSFVIWKLAPLWLDKAA
jgi:type IV secretory pathway TraG/TraD family ATPase VirD4|tara:strand:- start:1918 stop:2355 length:438 start_codon:yes stop_codon:yes gene_type:complete